MKKIYLVEERSFDLEKGNLMEEPRFIIYSSKKKAFRELEVSVKSWLKVGDYKLVEEGLFPNDYRVIEDEHFRRIIRIKEDYVF